MLNLLDFICASIAISSCLSGFYKGSVRLILINLSLILTFLLTFTLFEPAKNIISEYISSIFITKIISWGLAFLISAILVSILFRHVKKITRPICGGSIDKIIGLLLGMVNAFVINALIFLVLLATIARYSNHISRDNVYEFINDALKMKQPKWFKSSYNSTFIGQITNNVLHQEFVRKYLEEVSLDILSNQNADQEAIKGQLDQLFNNQNI